jgi:hypothetical protein
MSSNQAAVDDAWLLDDIDEFALVPRTCPDDFVDADDFLDQDWVAGYLALPQSVTDVLAEVSLFGTGPEAIRLLESLRERAMAPHHALQVAEAWERQARWLSTRTADANLAFVGTTVAEGQDAEREQSSRVLELALATDIGDQFLKQVVLPQARLLATTLAATRAEVEAGRLSAYRARKISDSLADLAVRAPNTARDIEAQVLTNAADLKLPSLTSKLRRLVLAARDPEEALEEHLEGARDRRVRVDSEPGEPGLLGLHAYLPAETTVAVRTALEAKAAELARGDKKRAADREGQRRTKDQRMADALAWFVLGPDSEDETLPARPRFTLQLTMSLPVLLALREGAAELPGYGPIPADLAREWAQDADWQRFVHDPVDGYLLDDGHTRYRPRAPGRRFTQHRDVLDRFPGSNRKAKDCDGDHIQPYTGKTDGGSTSSKNLASEGRPGHIAKTHSGWTVSGDANSVLVWTSPHGLVRRTAPYDYRDPGPPPF